MTDNRNPASARKHAFNFDDSPSATDTLGFDQGVSGLAKQIGSSNLPVVLGLFGRWGSGKSTFLQLLGDALLDQNIVKRKFFKVVFEPWKLGSSSDLMYDLVSALHVRARETESLTSQAGGKADELFNYLDNMDRKSLRALAFSGITHFIENRVGLGPEVGDILSRFLRATPLELAENRIKAASRLPDTFKQYLGALKSIPVILIDDLDRCRPETVVELFEALKLFLQASGSQIVYVLAMDHEMVINAICNRYGFESWQNGWQYLSKICNVNYFLPRPQVKQLLQSLVQELGSADDQLNLFWSCLTSQATEDLLYSRDLYLPRSLKRIVRQTHMALSAKSIGLVVSIKRIITEVQRRLPVGADKAETACYRFLLGVYMLREAYPEVYSRIAYKTHARRADFLLELANKALKFENLNERQAAIIALVTEWQLSELHLYFLDHIMLDFIARIFKAEDLLADCPKAEVEYYELILRREILNPVMDILMGL